MYAIRSYYEEQLIFYVEDSGMGIAPTQLDLIFNEFVKLDKNKAVITSYSIHYTKLYELFLMKLHPELHKALYCVLFGIVQ